MKKLISLLLLLSLLVSCNGPIDNPDNSQQTPSTIIELTYPTGIGTSGDTIKGLLGYGYDITGFCDTISVKAKVFDSLPSGNIYLDHPNSTFPTLVNGGSFEELLNKINYPNIITGSGEALTQHLKSLLKLADKDSIDYNYAFTYYAITWINLHRAFFTVSDNQQYLTSDFKKDVVTLTPEELVSKYGTHVLTDLFSGTKFEVLYRCKLGNLTSGDACENLFYNRMKEFVGGTPGIYKDINTNTKYSQKDEQLIYNSIGSRKKLCGVINATDDNPDSIRLDVNSVFDDNNIKTQFITIGPDGILPIYELINDATKKQEVKTYIENYMSVKTAD